MFDLIGVPYTSMARPGGIADAIGVLREAGLQSDDFPAADYLQPGASGPGRTSAARIVHFLSDLCAHLVRERE
jgi:hypothetical protein